MKSKWPCQWVWSGTTSQPQVVSVSTWVICSERCTGRGRLPRHHSFSKIVVFADRQLACWCIQCYRPRQPLPQCRAGVLTPLPAVFGWSFGGHVNFILSSFVAGYYCWRALGHQERRLWRGSLRASTASIGWSWYCQYVSWREAGCCSIPATS